MLNQPRQPASRVRLERELERERQQHISNHEAKARMNLDEGGRIKDARENFDLSRTRR